MPRYLLCPQCGLHRFYIPQNGVSVYFYVDGDRRPIPTETSAANLAGLDFATVYCCGCSWRGPLHKLVKYFLG